MQRVHAHPVLLEATCVPQLDALVQSTRGQYGPITTIGQLVDCIRMTFELTDLGSCTNVPDNNPTVNPCN